MILHNNVGPLGTATSLPHPTLRWRRSRTWRCWKRSDDRLVAHHGRQATILNLGILGLIVIHVATHGMIESVWLLTDYMANDLGMPPPEEPMAILRGLVVVNWGVLVAEYLTGIGLAIWAARGARRGELREFIFARTKKQDRP